nr:hypothetical protein [Tanacetum cinerariifolium]
MKTKRKLVPKTVVMGSVRETGYADVKGFCSGNVVECESAFVSVDNQLHCSIVGSVDSMDLPFTADVVCDVNVGCRPISIVKHRQTGSVDGRDLCLIADLVRDVDVGSHSYGSTQNCRTDQPGALLYENQKRIGAAIFTGNNIGGSDGPSSKRQHMSFDLGNQQLSNLNNHPVADREFLGVTGTFSILRASCKNNCPHEAGASSGENQKRSKGVTSTIREASDSVCPSSRRRNLFVDHRNLNTSNLNNNSTSINASSTHYEAHTGPLSEYKYVGKYEHSCEHCDARFWSGCFTLLPDISRIY